MLLNHTTFCHGIDNFMCGCLNLLILKSICFSCFSVISLIRLKLIIENFANSLIIDLVF